MQPLLLLTDGGSGRGGACPEEWLQESRSPGAQALAQHPGNCTTQQHCRSPLLKARCTAARLPCLHASMRWNNVCPGSQMRCNEVEMMERGRCHSLCTVRGRQTTLLELVLQPASQLRFGSGPTAGHRSVVLCSLVLSTVLCCDVLSVNRWPCPRSLPAPVSGHPAMQAAAIPAFQAPKSNQRPHTTKVQYSKVGGSRLA
jgi:hypothetical protein